MPKNNSHCISQCFPAGSKTTHPITMNAITADYPFCAIKYVVGKPYYARCSLEYPSGFSINNALDITTSPATLLLYLYGVDSMSGAIVWVIANEKANVGTIDRIMNIAWKEYGRDLTEIEDDLVNFYMQYLLPKWQIKNTFENVKKALVKLLNNYLRTEKDITDLKPHDWLKLKLL